MSFFVRGPTEKRLKETQNLFGGFLFEKKGQLCTEVNKEAANLWISGELSDCTFTVGTEFDKVTVHAHKLILAMASPVFRVMFYGGMANSDDAIPIVDVDPEVFKALLKYIYTGNININSTEEACQLCYAAKKYMMEYIVTESLSYLLKNLNSSNACQLYEFSKLFDAKPLMLKSLMIISTQTKEVLKDKSFEEIKLDTIITIFSLDNLNIDSELDLVDAIVRFAKVQNTKTKVIETLPSKCKLLDDESCNIPELYASENKPSVENCAENNSETVTENQKMNDVDQLIPKLTDLNLDTESKEQIRGAIEKIRFLALTAQEFAEYSARYNLLTDLDSYAVLLNIVSEKCSTPMPAGLSLCRTRRHAMVETGGKMNGSIATGINVQTILTRPIYGFKNSRWQRKVEYLPEEARSFASFRYTVHNIKNLKEPALSPPCYVNNLPWRIKVEPTLQTEGSKQKDLCLHLECNWDSETVFWNCKAKYEIKLISLASSGSCASSGSVTFNFTSQSPSDDVGVTWSEVIDPANEFVKDGAIIVEAKIEVI